MKELLYALPAGTEDTGEEWGLIPAYMSWRLVPGPRLSGAGGTARGGAMYLACASDPGGGEVQLCCRQIVGECRKRGFGRVICDLEGEAPGGFAPLCSSLGRACAQAGLALYLPEPFAPMAPECRVLVSSALTSGTLERRLGEAMERYGQERVVLAVEACAWDSPLPASGPGEPLAPDALRALMDRLEPAVFFDKGLCAHYFTYMLRGGGAHFVLFDTPRSVREKLDAAQRLGVPSVLLAAPQVGGWLSDIFS